MRYSVKKAQKLLERYSYRNNWELLKRIIQDYQIIVDYWPFEKDVLGMFWRVNHQNTIAVNANYTLNERIFVITHEIGHCFLNHGNNLCLINSLSSTIKQEQEANAFAAELLMPEEVMRDVFNSIPKKELINKFQVSERVILWRLKTLNLR